MPQPSAIETRSLYIGYQSKGIKNLLFENLNLTLRAGELSCFMGPNGVGKSTLLRTIAGLQKPLSGEVFFEGKTQPLITERLSRSLAKSVSVVLTDRVNAVNMSVYELVAFGRYPYLGWNTLLSEDDKRIIQRSIDFVQINHLTLHKIYELSDGQLQMVMIARALAQDTPIVLLDEPTAHLDLNNRLEIMNLLRKLARTTNKAILVATHELDLALQTADVIWLAGQHRTITTGMPEDLVLDGTFDKVFRFKGFDLKTGKVHHEAHRQISIKIVGDGHNYLWTKNALERCGFSITDQTATHTLTIVSDGNSFQLQMDGRHYFDSIHSLIDHLTNGADS